MRGRKKEESEAEMISGLLWTLCCGGRPNTTMVVANRKTKRLWKSRLKKNSNHLCSQLHSLNSHINPMKSFPTVRSSAAMDILLVDFNGASLGDEADVDKEVFA